MVYCLSLLVGLNALVILALMRIFFVLLVLVIILSGVFEGVSFTCYEQKIEIISLLNRKGLKWILSNMVSTANFHPWD